MPNRLRAVNLTLRAGFNVLVGPSGSGKSTCAAVVLGLLHPATGGVTHWGQDGASPMFRSGSLARPNPLQRVVDWFRLETEENRIAKRYLSRYCGYVAQRPYLPPQVTARAYVHDVHQARGNRVSSQRVVELAQELGVAAKLDDPVSQHSGGERQRVALVFALAHRPRLLVADEPTSSLDTSTGKQAIELVRRLVDQEELSTLWITHDTTALDYADYYFVAKDGVIQNASLSETGDR